MKEEKSKCQKLESISAGSSLFRIELNWGAGCDSSQGKDLCAREAKGGKPGRMHLMLLNNDVWRLEVHVCARAVLFGQAQVLETRGTEHSEGEHLGPIRTLESMSGSGYIRPGGYGGTSPVYTCCSSSFQASIVALPGLSVDNGSHATGRNTNQKDAAPVQRTVKAEGTNPVIMASAFH